MNGLVPPDLLPELRRLDLLLERHMLRLRAEYALSQDEFRGLYISDEQVDKLLAGEKGSGGDRLAELAREAEALRQGLPRGGRMDVLAGAFSLDVRERDVLLLAAAPELDPKYETVYAYANNDISRKHATVELALSLFAEGEERRIFRGRLGPSGRLFSQGLLERVEPPGDRRAGLSLGFVAAPAVACVLAGLPPEDRRAAGVVMEGKAQACGWEDLPVGPGMRERLRRLAELIHSGAAPPLVVMEAEAGMGGERIAGTLWAAGGLGLARLDPSREATEGAAAQCERMLLLARLRGAGAYLDLESPADFPAAAWRCLAQVRRPVLVRVPPGFPWRAALRGKACTSLVLEEPDSAERLRLWKLRLAEQGLAVGDDGLSALADRFRLTPGQIADAAAEAAMAGRLHAGAADGRELLFQAAREQGAGEIGKLAGKLQTRFGWEDLVLSESTMRRVREVADGIRVRHKVYGEWGMGRLGGSGGLMVLFAGASGTGKTMAVGVIARELGLDLYRIDLAAVVSKYIGETEKNLDRIFQAARRSNAILFFDEADALLGKRSEVKDAHDRYANIEVAYLLQKMEDHDGAVILATNLAKNMDQAFSRRMHYAVEFPRPDEKLRERLWRGIFPSQAPLGSDVDMGFLARQFEITGGDVRVVALDAAFLAAGDGGTIRMAHLVKAMARQMIKQGRAPAAGDFKEYFALAAQGA